LNITEKTGELTAAVRTKYKKLTAAVNRGGYNILTVAVKNDNKTVFFRYVPLLVLSNLAN